MHAGLTWYRMPMTRAACTVLTKNGRFTCRRVQAYPHALGKLAAGVSVSSLPFVFLWWTHHAIVGGVIGQLSAMASSMKDRAFALAMVVLSAAPMQRTAPHGPFRNVCDEKFLRARLDGAILRSM